MSLIISMSFTTYGCCHPCFHMDVAMPVIKLGVKNLKANLGQGKNPRWGVSSYFYKYLQFRILPSICKFIMTEIKLWLPFYLSRIEVTLFPF